MERSFTGVVKCVATESCDDLENNGALELVDGMRGNKGQVCG